MGKGSQFLQQLSLCGCHLSKPVLKQVASETRSTGPSSVYMKRGSALRLSVLSVLNLLVSSSIRKHFVPDTLRQFYHGRGRLSEGRANWACCMYLDHMGLRVNGS